MLLNVPVRAAEYLAAMPALAGPVPNWLHTLHALMTLDVVLLSSLYAIAFVAALRRVPLFPRLLAAIWMIDLAMQMVIAKLVAGTEGLPASVAAPLHMLLDGNVKKVLISVGAVAALSVAVGAGQRHLSPSDCRLGAAQYSHSRSPSLNRPYFDLTITLWHRVVRPTRPHRPETGRAWHWRIQSNGFVFEKEATILG